MIPREILKKIRQIELRTNRLVTETLGGQYPSVYQGQGSNSDDVCATHTEHNQKATE